MESRKMVLRETGFVLAGEAACTAVMLGIFALLGHFDRTVLLGGLLGVVLSVGNFFAMAANAAVASDRAAEQQDVKGGVAMMRFSYLIRMALIFIILFACVKSGWCNAIASVIPLLFVRWILTMREFFRKKPRAADELKS